MDQKIQVIVFINYMSCLILFNNDLSIYVCVYNIYYRDICIIVVYVVYYQ